MVLLMTFWWMQLLSYELLGYEFSVNDTTYYCDQHEHPEQIKSRKKYADVFMKYHELESY